jgi:DNA-binding response OmpR family regulator
MRMLAGMHRLHVAVVDEDRVAGEILASVLAASGARVTVARTFAELERAAETDPPDVVATDGMLDRRRRAAVLVAMRTSSCGALRRARLVRVGPCR